MIFSLKVFALDLLGLDMSRDEEEDLVCPEIMDDSEEDELCNEVMDRFERQRAFQSQLLQQSGGGNDPQTPVGTFEFDLEPFVDRQSSRMGVYERHFNTQLRQTGNFVDSPHVVQALQDGLRRAVDRVLTTTPNLHDQDRLYFTLSSNRLSSNFQGWGLRAGEWREGGARLDALFNRLAQALNSNEQFEMDDSFQLSITQVHYAPRGSGRKRHTKPGHQTLQKLAAKKRSVIRIQNDDDLCCARALVTAKARMDQHPKWNSIRKGGKLQKELALLLHHEADVPFGPCRYKDLTKFSTAPSLYDYQIVFVDADRSYYIKTFGPTQPKQLILLHQKDHYDVITSLPGFFGTSYVRAHCLKPYDHAGRHRCPNNLKKVQCRACCQKECPETHGVSKPLDVARSVIVTFWRYLLRGPLHQRPHRKTRGLPSVHHLLSSTSMSYLSQTGSGAQRQSTSSLRVHRMSFLPRARGRPNPSLLHSESLHPSRTPRAEEGTQTQTSTSRRSSRQTGCCLGSSNLASQ